MYLPINIKIENKKILIVGGGNVAAHKLLSITKFIDPAQVFVCAKEISEKVRSFGVNCVEQYYCKEQLEGAFLVYACTDDEQVNQQVCDDARSLGILINVADNSSLSDFISPAVYKNEHMSVAVSSQGKEVKKSVAWRNKITELLND